VPVPPTIRVFHYGLYRHLSEFVYCFGLFHGRAGPVKFFADESDDEGYAEMVMNSLKK